MHYCTLLQKPPDTISGGFCSLFRECVGAVGEAFEKIRILEINQNGVVFDVPFFTDLVDDFFA